MVDISISAASGIGDESDVAAGAVACPDCGAAQLIGLPGGRTDAFCWRCGGALERAAGRNAAASLACTVAGLLLLFPGNVLPLMRSHLLGASLDAYAIDGAVAYWQDGWPLVATFVGVFVVVMPFVRSAMLVAVLGSLYFGRRRHWEGLLFRGAEELRLWSMAGVYCLAGIVTYSRLAAEIEADVLTGGWCFISAALLLLLGDALLDRRRVWQAIRPDGPAPREMSSQGMSPQEMPHGALRGLLGCETCHLLVPASMDGGYCPRCGAALDRRKPDSLRRTAALTVAALVLYPAGLLIPMTRAVQPGGLVQMNVLDGVAELFRHGFWYLGIVLFTVSVAIPVLKLLVLGWMMLRVKYPRAKGLVLRTKIYRFIREINRWSFADPFIVGLTAPLMAYPGIADVHTGAGALPFALVVVLTMIAAHCFDTRLMWDAAERTHD
jgi:paraquat-inducible protein A